MTEANAQGAATGTAAPHFSIEKLYVKDMSLEVPGAPGVFLERETPQVDVQLHSQGQALEQQQGIFEVVLTATVTSKAKDKTMFLVEVAQAGIFQIRNVPSEQMEAVMGIACPNVLFPYLREAVSDVVTRAGFPPVLLSPVNFEGMYLQHRQRMEAAQSAPATTGEGHA